MKLWWSLALVGVAMLMFIVTARAESDLWEEDDQEVLVRTVRGTKERGTSGTLCYPGAVENFTYLKTSGTVAGINMYNDACLDLHTHSDTSHVSNIQVHALGNCSYPRYSSVVEISASGSTSSCRYAKGQWSECDSKTNTRSRTLNLKKGDKSCEQTKTIQKKCKKACRYEKGTWTGCVNQLMTRVDNLKANSDASCEKTRRLDKRCKPETNTKKSTKGISIIYHY
ncbi:hypothetical protein WH47_11692 [Habropoda laboriosa]|uniref:Pleiotrophin/Midkine C-terminal domain-containing protein n=1 Tax=Habropoda laboriosa TaxID=597456 RepID=A0A0L7R867_9HYME|nr:hypothetical protein WH47_11692 [Habropoda laboriosa]